MLYIYIKGVDGILFAFNSIPGFKYFTIKIYKQFMILLILNTCYTNRLRIDVKLMSYLPVSKAP